MAVEKLKTYTADEFFELVPERNSLCELHKGVIVDFASPNELHQKITREIMFAILTYIKGKKGKCEAFNAPFDVKLNYENVVQPDIFIVCDKDKLDGKRCNGAPDFVIEISSTNHFNDFYRKFNLYREFGVREYWIIDTDREMIQVDSFEHNSHNVYRFNEPVPVGIYDGELTINLSEILE